MINRLHCLEAGLPTLPCVVLLHGFGGQGEDWRVVIDGIKSFAHALAFDLPGHSGSLTYPNFGSPRIAAEAIGSELRSRGIDRFHLVGHSMGGAVSVLLALENPARAASLTLLAPGGFGSEINADLMERYARAKSSDELSACFEAMSGRRSAAPQPWVSRTAAARAQPIQMDALALILSKIMRGKSQGKLPLEALEALRIPVHLLWGEHDPIVSITQVHNAPSRFKKTNLLSAGHMLIEEEPKATVNAILGQLA